MKYTLTDQLLLLLADWSDFNRRFWSWKLLTAYRRRSSAIKITSLDNEIFG